MCARHALGLHFGGRHLECSGGGLYHQRDDVCQRHVARLMLRLCHETCKVVGLLRKGGGGGQGSVSTFKGTANPAPANDGGGGHGEARGGTALACPDLEHARRELHQRAGVDVVTLVVALDDQLKE